MKAFEAVKLFDELSKSEAMHNDMPNTGCFVRAKLAAEKMQEKGFAAMLVWTDLPNRNLQGRVSYFEDQDQAPKRDNINWSFHVAAAAKVKNLQGSDELLVFDTALFDGPTSVDAWAKAMFIEGYPLQESDTKVMDYNLEGSIALDKVFADLNCNNGEGFFSKQPQKYLNKRIVRRPSKWLKNYNNFIKDNHYNR